MSKYIFINQEDGAMTVHEGKGKLAGRLEGGVGYWVVEVPNDFTLRIDLSQIHEGATHLYQYVLDHKDSEVVYRH